MAQGFLNVAEQASCTREGEYRGPDFSKDLVPVFEDDSLVVGGGDG